MQFRNAMRKSVILLMLAVMTVVTGCDFFRVLAGRPTGKDIDARRVEIMKSEEAALQARLDSIRRAEEKVVADSLAALDSLAAQGVIMTGASRLGGLGAGLPAHRYHIITGAFRDRANARKLADKAVAEGYEAELIECRTGIIAVGLCPSDRIAVTYDALQKLRHESFFPKDSWILLNE